MSVVIAVNRMVAPQVLGFETALQKATHSALVNALPAYTVYDDVPQNAALPYITVGDDAVADWSADTFLGAQATVTVHTWSRGRGREETKRIQGLVYNALNRATLESVGYTFVTSDMLGSESFMDADGKTRHGVQTFNVIMKRK